MIQLSTLSNICYYSIVFSIISIMCFSYKEETVIVAYMSFALSSLLMISYIAINGQKVKLYNFHYMLIGWMLWSVVSAIWSLDSELSLMMSWTLTQLCLYAFIFFEFMRQRDMDNIKFLEAIAIGTLAMGAYSLYHYGFGEFTQGVLGGVRLGGDINQENTYGSFAMLGLISSTGLILKNRNLINIVAFIFSGIMVVASGSRMALLTTIISILLLFWLCFGRKYFFKFLLCILVVTLSMVALVQFAEDSQLLLRLEQFINIFSASNSADNSTIERIFMIKYGLEQFIYSPVWGYGINCFRVLYQQETGWATYSHNNFVELLVGVGLVGFFIYYMFYYIILRNMDRSTIENKTLWVVIVSTFIEGVFSPNYYMKLQYIIFAIGYLTINYKQKSERI